MRTAGPTAQAAGPVGEGRPPKAQGPAEAPSLGRGRISPGLSQVCGALSIHRPILRAAGFAYCGRFYRKRPFFVVRRHLLAC